MRHHGISREENLWSGSNIALIPLAQSSRYASDDNLPQTPRCNNPNRKRRFRARWRRFWIAEVLWCVVGLGSGAAIITMLAQYNGQRAPEWPLGISLNTVLALLASAAKASLLIPIVEGLGQLRWFWFSKRARPVEDFELFDSATRGTLGSLRLLAARKGGVLGFVAALVTVTSLLVSTVTQAVIQYETRPYPFDSGVQTPRVTVFKSDRFFLDSSADTYTRVLGLKKHILAGGYSLVSEPLSPEPVGCSTGECSFPDFVTIGICTDVADVSTFLNTSRPPDQDWKMPGFGDNATWSAALPGGQNLTIPTIFAFNLYSAPTLAFSALSNQSFAAAFLLYSNVIGFDPSSNTTTSDASKANPRVEFRAAELVWYWCTKSYSVSVRDGRTRRVEMARSTRVVEDTTLMSLDVVRNPAFWQCAFQLSPKPCEETAWGSITLAPPPGSKSKNDTKLVVEELTSVGLSSFLSMSFWNGVEDPLSRPVPGSASDGVFKALGRSFYRIQGDLSLAFAINLWQDMTGKVDPHLQIPILRNLTANIGQGIEDFILSDWGVHPQTEGPVNGTVFVSAPFVIIRWGWLSYLLAELVLSSLFLLAIITWTASVGAEPLRVSTFATLCALDEPTRQRLGHLGEYDEVCRRAEGLSVMLIDGPNGLTLRRR